MTAALPPSAKGPADEKRDVLQALEVFHQWHRTPVGDRPSLASPIRRARQLIGAAVSDMVLCDLVQGRIPAPGTPAWGPWYDATERALRDALGDLAPLPAGSAPTPDYGAPALPVWGLLQGAMASVGQGPQEEGQEVAEDVRAARNAPGGHPEHGPGGALLTVVPAPAADDCPTGGKPCCHTTPCVFAARDQLPGG